MYAERYEPVANNLVRKILLRKYCRKRMIQNVINRQAHIQRFRPFQRKNLRYDETKIAIIGTFTQFICIADGYCVLSRVVWQNWKRINIGKLANRFIYILLHPLQNWWNDLTFTFLGIAHAIVWIGIVTYLMDYYRNE